MRVKKTDGRQSTRTGVHMCAGGNQTETRWSIGRDRRRRRKRCIKAKKKASPDRGAVRPLRPTDETKVTGERGQKKGHMWYRRGNAQKNNKFQAIRGGVHGKRKVLYTPKGVKRPQPTKEKDFESG